MEAATAQELAKRGLYPETRAQWYARKHGGGWRIARKDRRCDCSSIGGLRCLALIPAGTKYFDTNTMNGTFRGTKKFCAQCANKQAGG